MKYIIKIETVEGTMIFEYLEEDTWIKYWEAFKKEYNEIKISRYSTHFIKKQHEL